MSNRQRVPEVDSSLHIIKGAIVRVLNTPLTVSTECYKKSEGRIAVQWEGPKPTQQQLDEIERLANEKIRENVDIEVTPMAREEAEEKFRKNPVNNTFIYDKFPVPAEVKTVNILHIKDWNVNACSGTHVKKTGEVRPIKIARINHREAKKELEIVYELIDNPNNNDNNTTSAKGKGKGGKAEVKSNNNNTNSNEGNKAVVNADDVHAVANQLLNLFMEQLQQSQVDVQGKQEDIKKALIPKVESKLNSMKNIAFTKGFTQAPHPEYTKMMSRPQ